MLSSLAQLTSIKLSFCVPTGEREEEEEEERERENFQKKKKKKKSKSVKNHFIVK